MFIVTLWIIFLIIESSFLIKFHHLIGKVFRQEYDLEYGSDCIEMHIGAVAPDDRALVVDDLIATGGTLCAAMKLLGILFVYGACLESMALKCQAIWRSLQKKQILMFLVFIMILQEKSMEHV